MDRGEVEDVIMVRDGRFSSFTTHAIQTTHATRATRAPHATQASVSQEVADASQRKGWSSSGQQRCRGGGAVNLVIRSDSPRVVATEPENFREVVQRLTGLRRSRPSRHLQPKNRQKLRRSSSSNAESLATAVKMEDSAQEQEEVEVDSGLDLGLGAGQHRQVQMDVCAGLESCCGKQLEQPTLRSPDSVLDAAASGMWPPLPEFCNGGLELGCRLLAGPAAVPSWIDVVSMASGPVELLSPPDCQDGICASAAALQEPYCFIDPSVGACGSLLDSSLLCPSDYSLSAIADPGASHGVQDYEADLQGPFRKPALQCGQATADACNETATPTAAPSSSWFWVDGSLDGVQEDLGYMPALDPQPPSIFQLQSTGSWDGF